MKALVIRSPWIDLILSGSKTWEMRTRSTSIRGPIALIKAGSGLVLGTAELLDCLPALTPEQLRQTQSFHAIPDSEIENAIANRWTTPWVLGNVTRFPVPKPYRHPSGAVTWVDLGDTLAGLDNAPAASDQPAEPIVRSKARPAAGAPVPPPQAVCNEWVDIPLTAGNIRNGHFYLRGAQRLLPTDCIGGSNRSEPGKTIRVRFDPDMLVETDVAGDKMILRCRSQVHDFFMRTSAQPGNQIRFARAGERDFLVSLIRSATPSN